MSKLSLSSLDKTHLEGKKVLVRVDFNVPLNEDGQTVSYTHLRAHETHNDLVCRLLL